MIGVLADTHDNLEAIKAAVEVLNERDLDLAVHAGDIISPFTAKYFKNLNAKLYCVVGNNDGEKEGLIKVFSNIGVEVRDFLTLEIDERNIAVYHGTVPEFVQGLADCGSYDVVISGHTHRPDIRYQNDVLVVNPGEVCGYLTGIRSVAVLDLEELKAELIEF